MSYNVRVIGADESANSGYGQALVAVAARAKLFTVTAYNQTAGTLYLQAHDAAVAPADTAVPKLVTPVFGNTSGGFNFTDGVLFNTGIYLCFSSTDVTKTVADVPAGAGIIDATYRRQ